MNQLSKKIESRMANALVKTMSFTDSVFGQFRDKVLSFRKKLVTPESSQLVSKAIEDLDDIQKMFFFCRGEKFQKITTVFDSQVCYRPSTFADGLVFQIQAETHVCKKIRRQTILAGGRYDSALLRERHPRDLAFEVPQSIVGFGVDVELLASIREYLDVYPPPTNNQSNAITNRTVSRKVLICSKEIFNGVNMIQEKFRLARELWNLNIPADVFHIPIANLDTIAVSVNFFVSQFQATLSGASFPGIRHARRFFHQQQFGSSDFVWKRCSRENRESRFHEYHSKNLRNATTGPAGS